jgi:hypothetical protein
MILKCAFKDTVWLYENPPRHLPLHFTLPAYSIRRPFVLCSIEAVIIFHDLFVLINATAVDIGSIFCCKVIGHNFSVCPSLRHVTKTVLVLQRIPQQKRFKPLTKLTHFFPLSDPDLMANDGIYSRYMTDFSGGEGRYTVTLHVSDNQGRAFSHQMIEGGFVFSSTDSMMCQHSSFFLLSFPLRILYSSFVSSESPRLSRLLKPTRTLVVATMDIEDDASFDKLFISSTASPLNSRVQPLFLLQDLVRQQQLGQLGSEPEAGYVHPDHWGRLVQDSRDSSHWVQGRCDVGVNAAREDTQSRRRGPHRVQATRI